MINAKQKGDFTMYCSICGTEIYSIDDVVEQGWIPSFWDADVHHEAACPNCSEIILQDGEDLEYEVKPEYQGKIVYLDPDSGKHHMVMGVALGFDARNN